MLGSNKIIIWK